MFGCFAQVGQCMVKKRRFNGRPRGSSCRLGMPASHLRPSTSKLHYSSAWRGHQPVYLCSKWVSEVWTVLILAQGCKYQVRNCSQWLGLLMYHQQEVFWLSSDQCHLLSEYERSWSSISLYYANFEIEKTTIVDKGRVRWLFCTCWCICWVKECMLLILSIISMPDRGTGNWGGSYCHFW